MTKSKNLVGLTFGSISVISRADKALYGGHFRSAWNCQCLCGTSWLVMETSLLSGNTKSCGCLHRERISKLSGQAAFSALYNSYKSSAKKRCLEFKLTKSVFLSLTSKNCFYCGIEPEQEGKPSRHYNGIYLHNGIDRLNNRLGYIEENVVPCCKVCNRAKLDMSYVEFNSWVHRLVAFRQRIKDGTISS